MSCSVQVTFAVSITCHAYSVRAFAKMDRRGLLRTVRSIVMPAVIPAPSRADAVDFGFHSSAETAHVIWDNCAFFLSAIGPVSANVILWRGASMAELVEYGIIISPPYDLLDEDTYGTNGAEFFRIIEKAGIAAATPSKSHIAVGNRLIASHWGPPVTVWPVGPFSYTYDENRKLIYEDECFENGHMGKEQLINNIGLRDAIRKGKEIMFSSPSYVAVRDEKLIMVLKYLQMYTERCQDS